MSSSSSLVGQICVHEEVGKGYPLVPILIEASPTQLFLNTDTLYPVDNVTIPI